ncbi:MAG: phenylacetate--CoA ligase, partial [Euryarchaeota archaeon]|nr:phenylacetate--CoA ligase [Euryarchaeota archaeon]
MNIKGEIREYWQAAEETLPFEKLEELQGLRLRNTVERVYEHVPFYRNRLKELGITPSDITKRDDVENLPFTKKTDLRNHFPFGLFAVPHEQVIRVHASSGTSGPPTVVGYTLRDIANWANMMARCLT